MSLRDEIKPYIDGNGLVAPFKCSPITRASDNGVLFTSQYYILLAANNELIEDDSSKWESLMSTCMAYSGVLVRAPGDDAVEGPDDHYGLLAAAKILNRPKHAIDILDRGKKTFGYYNAGNKFDWQGFQWRQLQMVAAMISAANLAGWWKFWQWPVYFAAFVTILISCVGAPLSDVDSRVLSWCLIKTVCPDSFWCRVASRFWYRRLYKHYGKLGMKSVAEHYFEPGHPFIKYWVD